MKVEIKFIPFENELKSVKTLNSFEEVTHLLEVLEQEFRLTNFELIKNLLRKPNGSVHVNLSFNEELGFGGNGFSELYLKIDFDAIPSLDGDYGDYTFKLVWITCSGHTVCIDGNFNCVSTSYDLEGQAVVSIGEDESIIFYPALLETLNGI